MLLVSGYTSQMLGWDEGFCRALAAHGRHVVRYDNRDVGLSTHFDGVEIDMPALKQFIKREGPMPDVPYTLDDMAADGVGLADALGAEIVDVVGMSMGGMIVQTMAVNHGRRLRSVVSVMSTTGDRNVGRPLPEAFEILLTAPPDDRAGYIDASVNAKIWSSKRYFDEARCREKAAASYDRMFYPEGYARQMAAIVALGDRSESLRTVDVPMLVIHGVDDTLISQSGGEATAALVPGAELLIVDDMGHDIPEPLWPTLTSAIAAFGDRAGRSQSRVTGE